MPPRERKALQSILQCRTRVMGGRSYRCAHCEQDHFAWHSCNHRLCPRCGSSATRSWVAEKLEGRLPVEHFLVTFTLPAQLRGLCRYEAKAFLKAFFSSSARSVKDVLEDPRHLGGSCGFVGMLQTWTQELQLHPHIHYIVPAVALDGEGKIKRPKKAGWLAPGKVFAERLKTLLLKSLQEQGLVRSILAAELRSMDWNCDVKSFGDGANAIKYLGGYLCRGPISDSRILGAADGNVRISVRNRDTEATETRSIEAVEFVRRYLQHALPSGFHAIRYYGFMHARSKAKLASIREQLGVRSEAGAGKGEVRAEPEPMLCPRCRKPMEMTGQHSRAPPWERRIARIWARGERAAA